mmetsp:Transcript_121255/g.214493  ORF Transcript_121255/g.214493 Transcript_121255/m.214493 type:complete len:206 (+) Transcript_121255:3-620(+)
MNNMMGSMMGMMNNMMGSMMGPPMHGSMMGGRMLQQGESWAGPGSSGSFTCQTMSFSSSVGPDGRVHTREFSSSTVADGGRRVRETKQAYRDTSTGFEKMSMERQMGERGRKVVRERCETTGEEKETDMRKGISEEQCDEFNEDWQREAAPHLPWHRVQLQLEGGSSASSSSHKGSSKGSAGGNSQKGSSKGFGSQSQRYRASPY